jgi:hypothetical protein
MRFYTFHKRLLLCALIVCGLNPAITKGQDAVKTGANAPGMNPSNLKDISASDVTKAINIKSLRHPFLFFTEQEKPAMLNRIQNDPESKHILNKLLLEARRFMFMPVSREIPRQGENPRADWTEDEISNKYQTYLRGYREAAFVLSFTYQLTGDVKYAQKAFEFADAYCAVPTWTQGAHEFPIIYNRIMPWNVPDDQVNFSFDISTGDGARDVAIIYDWTYQALNQRQRDRIRGALLERAITKVRGNYEFHWWATAYRCNWNNVCNSGAGIAALALLPDHPQLTDVVAESFNRITKTLSQLDENGGWQEGGGYWNYSVSTAIYFADALKRLSNGKHNLFKTERFANNPVTFPVYISLPGNGSVNFEDSGSHTIGATHILNKIATETGSNAAAWYRKEKLNDGDDVFDLIWPRPSVEPLPFKNPSLHFKGIDWWVMRSDFTNPDNTTVVGKAGKNDDPHHGHLDIGQFIVYWKNKFFISEINRGSYDQEYFSELRWEYPQASSQGHNLIFVNGENQSPGKLWKKPFDYEKGGKVEEFRASPQRDYVIMDPTNAYEKNHLKGWRRHITLEKPNVTIVLDEVNSKAGSEIEQRFHSECSINTTNRFTLLSHEVGKMAIIPIGEDIVVKKGKLGSLPINGLAVYKDIEYTGNMMKAKGEQSLLPSVILPVSDEKEAERIAQSAKRTIDGKGNLLISFEKEGKTYSYTYKKESKGYRLQD